LKPGERVVAEDLQKVEQGMIVNPIPYSVQPQAKAEASSISKIESGCEVKSEKR
jgi:hypothetical protein